MIPSDKEIVDALLPVCEHLYVQNILLRGLVRKAGVADWRDTMDKQANSVVANLARADFQKHYAQAVREQQNLKELMEGLLDSGTVQ